MSDMRDKLDAILKRQGLMTGAQWMRQRETMEKERAEGRYEADRILPGEAISSDDAGFFLVRQDFPADCPQGNVPLGSVLATKSRHIAFSACDPELGDFDPMKTLFMDTETIGLAGGAGTVAFLVGAGYWVDETTFRLDQCFMRDYDEEEPMLAFLAERFAGYQAVVGYNSKCFDLPLLRTRFIQNRIPFRLDGFLHFDLMHAARRFWKDRLGSCTLKNVEQAILGLHRRGDVPSHLIPQIWFDYLRTRDARPLQPVFYHHRMDILSLVALTGLISQLLETPDGAGFEHAQDRLSLVRIHYRQKQYAAVAEHAARFLEQEDQEPLRRECLEMLAMALKRLQQFAPMQEAWERLAEECPGHVMARLELAKHHEHHTRNLAEAERLCAEALDILEARPAWSGGAEAATARVRLERIRRKRARGLAGNAHDTDLPGL